MFACTKQRLRRPQPAQAETTAHPPSRSLPPESPIRTPARPRRPNHPLHAICCSAFCPTACEDARLAVRWGRVVCGMEVVAKGAGGIGWKSAQARLTLQL
ncbi:hypothetical protein BJY59DRAFT_690522 [Rhodotorula toruloides]